MSSAYLIVAHCKVLLTPKYHQAVRPCVDMLLYAPSYDCSSDSTITVNALPPELLIEIFQYCVQGLDDDLVPLTLASVCRYWHDVAHTSPSVWQHIFLSDRRKVATSHAQVSRWLDLSAALPIHIHVGLPSADLLLPLMSPLLPAISRWQRCTIRIAQHEESVLLLPDACKMSVKHLTVKIKGVHDDLLESSPPSPNIFVIDSLPDLEMHMSLLDLPLRQHIAPLSFTSLTIKESLDVCTDPTRILQFISAFPALQELNFKGFPPDGFSESDTFKPPIVNLLQLRVLVLRSTCAVRVLLSHIHAPALEELYIKHTNIDFEMQNDPYHGLTEEGDSEDEAHDFSQSPWSDHATGMGLRSLIRRSNPPLRILHMDYADMRTKDFKWCFDRLETLEKFFIVASDMSDKAISLLAPTEIGGSAAGMDVPHAAIPMPDGGMKRVRMPKLTSLELWNCQRLSGDAIVEALRDRVQYTDDASRADCGVDTLKDACVVGCAGFSARHALSLSPVLGTRLHLSGLDGTLYHRG
ncbi:uncharacterized protein LAESUDRAFT_719766 [Laetiporus sulphureus 93-53]|uniref:F-box domain-containing protein n=1 Tax=Laetiporus sulphureus 93-53 TaxID=1314785 RepID=A0A165HK15_9APHY|nr:uncharacterized protein LAESUDRAFT_719766 [Laetiporus sulphureus 93-53]KZT11830.1 hypothetical protein LAESUDRAFT_719766 [Laetiporus sulphureus 93-53]